MVTKPIDWSIYTPGGTGVGQTQRPGQTTNMADYTTLYNQQQNVGYNTGSGTTTTAPFAMAGKPSVSPYDVFDAAGLSGIPTANDPIANLQKTQGEVFTEAQARYLAMATENRQLQSEGIQRAGGDQYAQARMAMEQQMALSDTRGLTAGAKEGAQQTLSATQQVALNQIESNTQSQLLELKAQGVQDEFLAQEYAHMKYQELSITDSRFGVVDDLMMQYQDAMNRSDTKEMQRLTQEVTIRKSEIRNGLLTEEERKILDNPGASEIEISATADATITRVLEDPGTWDVVTGLGLIAIGLTTIVVAGAVTFASLGTLSPITVPAKFAGKAALVAGFASLTTGGIMTGTEIGKTRSLERETTRVNNILKRQRRSFLAKGFTNEEIDIAFRARMAQEAPAYRDIIGR